MGGIAAGVREDGARRAWLGHVSLNTTNVYAEVDLEMKAKALATCEIRGAVPSKHWTDARSVTD
jgi:integrase/recombinase XerD